MQLLILMLVGFALIWLFVLMPNRRRQSAHRSMIESLESGDEVITAGGVYGFVSRVDEDFLELEVADGVEIKVAKRAIAALVPPEEEDEEELEADEEIDELEAPEDEPIEDSVEQRRS